MNEIKVKKKKIRYYIVIERHKVLLCWTDITQTPVLLKRLDQSLLAATHRFHTDPHYTNKVLVTLFFFIRTGARNDIRTPYKRQYCKGPILHREKQAQGEITWEDSPGVQVTPRLLPVPGASSALAAMADTLIPDAGDPSSVEV